MVALSLLAPAAVGLALSSGAIRSTQVNARFSSVYMNMEPLLTPVWGATFSGRNPQAEPVSHPAYNPEQSNIPTEAMVGGVVPTKPFTGRNPQAVPVSHPAFDPAAQDKTRDYAEPVIGGIISDSPFVGRNPQAVPVSHPGA